MKESIKVPWSNLENWDAMYPRQAEAVSPAPGNGEVAAYGQPITGDLAEGKEVTLPPQSPSITKARFM